MQTSGMGREPENTNNKMGSGNFPGIKDTVLIGPWFRVNSGRRLLTQLRVDFRRS